MAPRSWVTDLTDFLDETGEPPGGPAGKLAEYFGTIAMLGSLLVHGMPVHSALRCRARPRRQPCPGRLVIQVDDSAGAERRPIHWDCPACGERGRIDRWDGTLWDLSLERHLAALLEDDGLPGELH